MQIIAAALILASTLQAGENERARKARETALAQARAEGQILLFVVYDTA